MSIAVETQSLDDETMKRVARELVIKLEDKYCPNKDPVLIHPYRVEEDVTVLPFAWAHRDLGLPRPTRDEFNPIEVEFVGKLRPHQLEVNEEAVRTLTRQGSVVLSMYCGFGKSLLAIHLAVAIGFKTLVVVHNVALMKQWEEEIIKFCPAARVRRVTPQSPYKDADFFVINAQNAEKKGRAYFGDIGLMVIDEAHKVMAAKTSKVMDYVQPRYLIGLSATPYRPDALNKLFPLFFGLHPKIERKFWRKHIVYRVRTGFTPTLQQQWNGKLDWNLVLESLAQKQERNEMIVNLICDHPDRTFMVLTKRLSQGDYLEQQLRQRGQTVTSLLRSKQDYDPDARVLIGTVSKIGTGFNHPALDALLLASDVEQYFVQYLGRVFRRPDGIPLIFDLVDNHASLEKHYRTRASVYVEHGGHITDFEKPKLKAIQAPRKRV